MKHLLGVIKKFKVLIFVYIIMGITSSFLSSFSSSYFQKVIDNFKEEELTLTNIIVYGTVMILLYLINYLDEYPSNKLENGINLNLKLEAIKKISVIDYLSYIKLGTGSLVQRIENGALAGSNILYGFYLQLFSKLLPEIIFSIAFIYMISSEVAMILLLGYIVVFVITNLLLKVMYKVKSNILINEEKLNHFLVRGFMEMVVFRVNRRFEYEIKKAESSTDEIISSKVKMKLIHEAFFTIFAILIAFVKIGILIYGWKGNDLTIGDTTALILLVDNAYTPIAIFNVLYVDYKLDKITFSRYEEFLDAQEDNHLLDGDLISEIKEDIKLLNISFGYHERNILDNFSLTIPKGKSMALVGESGSGKSTTVKLLVGLLHPDKGRILINGKALNTINLNSYYQRISYVPQDPPIFNGTLRENLIFDELVDDALLIKAIHEVGLEELFSKLDNGLDTPLGERGVSLSGGERQQLALARIWFSNADIYIFDEATSAIDNLTEEFVMRNVMRQLVGKTVISIAHRLDSIKDFDEIIVFQNGNIVEQGKFDILINKHQYFYELYNRSTSITN